MKIDRSDIEKLIITQLEEISTSKSLKYQFKYQLIELNVPVKVIDSLLKKKSTLHNTSHKLTLQYCTVYAKLYLL
ncbi:hypothetical protein Q0F98_05880 [Paenibacillus amylolyticus]|nr:hypothetical protein Q0F98_05880 [Paenibacillus amylolyticus]